MVKKSLFQFKSPKQIVSETARTRRCDTEIEYTRLNKEKFEPDANIEVTYLNGATIAVAVREVLESGSLSVMSCPTILNFDHIKMIRNLNKEGADVIQQIREKMQESFETRLIKIIPQKLSPSLRSDMDLLERKEKIERLTSTQVMLTIKKKSPPEVILNDNAPALQPDTITSEPVTQVA